MKSLAGNYDCSDADDYAVVVVVVDDDADVVVVVAVVAAMVVLFKRTSRLLIYVVTMHYEKLSQGGDCDVSVGSSGGSGSFLYFIRKIKSKQRLVCERGDVCDGAVRLRQR